jgi:hypothetical protein
MRFNAQDKTLCNALANAALSVIKDSEGAPMLTRLA